MFYTHASLLQKKNKQMQFCMVFGKNNVFVLGSSQNTQILPNAHSFGFIYYIFFWVSLCFNKTVWFPTNTKKLPCLVYSC